MRPLITRTGMVIGFVTFLYILTIGLLAFFAKAAISAPTIQTVPINSMQYGGLFLATPDPERVQPALLQMTDANIVISGSVAEVTVTQTFSNTSLDWVEGIYVYPLPEDAAVHSLVLDVNGRLTVGDIKEKQEAERIYEEATERGQTASLVSSERPNIFTTMVANIGPEESIRVTFKYHQPVIKRDNRYTLRFPTVVRPRYIPGNTSPEDIPDGYGIAPDTDQVPDASRITPPLVLDHDSTLNPFHIVIHLDAGVGLGEILSAHHPIEVERDGLDKAVIRLADGPQPADRDFLLEWTLEDRDSAAIAVFGEQLDGYDYRLVTIQPPTLESVEVDNRAREQIFILDVSGSMAGTAIREARAALDMALARLTPDQAFNVIFFSNDARRMFQEARRADTETIRAARRAIASTEADGGTNMESALNLALDGLRDESRLRQIIFITDGAVGNEEALFRMIHERLGDSRLFTVGISSTPNSFFMEEAAEAGRGSYVYIAHQDDVQKKMNDLFMKLERPVLTDMELKSTGNDVEIYPAIIPDLYYGEPVTVSLRYPAGSVSRLEFTGKQSGTVFGETVLLDQKNDNRGIAKVWAYAKITDIIRTARRNGTRYDADTRAAIVDVALGHQIITEYTALVAVDPEVRREKTEKLLTDAIPSNLPDGMDWEAGLPASPANMKMQPAPISFQRQALASAGIASFPQTASGFEQLILIGLLLLATAALVQLVYLIGRRVRL